MTLTKQERQAASRASTANYQQRVREEEAQAAQNERDTIAQVESDLWVLEESAHSERAKALSRILRAMWDKVK